MLGMEFRTVPQYVPTRRSQDWPRHKAKARARHRNRRLKARRGQQERDRKNNGTLG